MLLGWVLGWAFVYAALFGAGSFLYGQMTQATVWLVVFVVTGAWLTRMLTRLWASADDGDERPDLPPADALS